MDNSSIHAIESFFIPLDIIWLITTIVSMIFSCLYIIIILFDKTCHTQQMLLLGNSCLSALLFEIIVLFMSIFTLTNDLRVIFIPDSLCIIWGYFGYVFASMLYYSFFIQAVYRYLTAVYPTRSFYESYKFILLMINTSWLVSFIFPLELILTHGIVYNAANQICQLVMNGSISLIYLALFIFTLPMMSIGFIYFLLVRYVKKMNERMATGNAIGRARNQLKMIRHILILVSVLLVVGIPYSSFAIMSFFTAPPKYSLRIGVLLTNLSLLCVQIILFQLTDPLKDSIMNRFKRNNNTVVALALQTRSRTH